MKISRMTTDKVADVYLQLLPDIKVLTEDEELKRIIDSRKKSNDEGEAEKLGKLGMMEVTAYLLRYRRENLWNILGIVNGMTPDEVAEQNIIQLSMQVLDIFGDKDLIGFFISLTKLGQIQL